MRSAFCLAVLLAVGAPAAEVSDRAAIDRLVAAFNKRVGPARDLFCRDAPDNSAELEKLTRSDSEWSDKSAPHLVIRSIHFATPNRALVDAESVRYGSVNLVKSFPVHLVVERRARRWLIYSLHVQP